MKYVAATRQDVIDWLTAGLFTVGGDGKVTTKAGSVLTPRINKRRRSERGDARVDLYAEGMRRSINVSHLVWMSHTGVVIPDGFELHHKDEDIANNTWPNLVCVYKMDHPKLHDADVTDSTEEFLSR